MADELCSSPTCNISKTRHFQFLLAHPLYFSYLIFFSPYLLRFISFLSPLFLTTSLLLLLHPKLAFLQTLRSKLDFDDEELCDFEDFEIYKIVFRDTLPIAAGDEVEEVRRTGGEEVAVEGSAEAGKREEEEEEEKRLEKLIEELDIFEDCTQAIPTKEYKKTSSDSGKVVGDSALTRSFSCVTTEPMTSTGEQQNAENPVQNVQNSGKITANSNNVDRNEDAAAKSSSWRSDSSNSLASYGSMRKEKEWKRTLACKLFEERQNPEGGEEGMDSLWESYENDHSTGKSIHRRNTTIKNKNKSGTKFSDQDYDLDEDDDDEEFMMSNGQLCCLKAFKLSAGKMNLGMGKPNLVKISKALKGFGWLHHVGRKNGKRG